MVLVLTATASFHGHHRYACGRSDARRSRVAGWRFRLRARPRKPQYQLRTFAYLSDLAGGSDMPAGI